MQSSGRLVAIISRHHVDAQLHPADIARAAPTRRRDHHGGRQDYMNWFMKSREVTIEISDTKLLPPSQLPAHWEYNKRSFLNYIESIFYGVRGIVTDTLGHPLNAIVKVLNHDTLNSTIRTDSINGNYHRMLASGVYSFQFSADGHYSKIINNVVVNNFQTTVIDVELIPEFIPVELISFTAETNGNDVELKWRTATEKNNQGFDIKRRAPSKSPPKGETFGQWEAIAFISGFGTSTEIHFYSFTDIKVSSGFYQYRLKQIDFDGSFTFSNIVEIEIAAPNVFTLEQNYPNPFNPSTKIKYTLPSVIASETKQSQLVTLKVYDILGNEIVTLVNEEKSTGSYEVEFNSHSGNVRNLTNLGAEYIFTDYKQVILCRLKKWF